MEVYLEKGIQTPMAQGRSTKIISMIKWIRTSRLSIKNPLSLHVLPVRMYVCASAAERNCIDYKTSMTT